jgi:hypothetical protein
VSDGSQLQRYASRLNAAEINTRFFELLRSRHATEQGLKPRPNRHIARLTLPCSPGIAGRLTRRRFLDPQADSIQLRGFGLARRYRESLPSMSVISYPADAGTRLCLVGLSRRRSAEQSYLPSAEMMSRAAITRTFACVSVSPFPRCASTELMNAYITLIAAAALPAWAWSGAAIAAFSFTSKEFEMPLARLSCVTVLMSSLRSSRGE